ncbi:hypothetical protein IV02_17600 [Pseudomonas syringae]|uniref:Uncharacterized protein n=1 Tax=Pseudomonas syringae TaxID=317 RepID=A0A085V483_PSESX|nr:hypothetical protein IV02_17600 [Pseudomonas syringae]
MHSDAMTRRKRAKADTPGFIGQKTGKRGFRDVFQIALDQFKPENPCPCWDNKSPVDQAGRGLQPLSRISQSYPLQRRTRFIFHDLKKRQTGSFLVFLGMMAKWLFRRAAGIG